MEPNLEPQYQLQTFSGKVWEMKYFDSELPVIRLRYEYQKTCQRPGTQIRIIGLRGEILEHFTVDQVEEKKVVDMSE